MARERTGGGPTNTLAADLKRHSSELKKHSKDLAKATAGQRLLVKALNAHTAALGAIQIDEPGQKEQAIMDCITDWLHQHRKLDPAKEADPEATMDKTYHFGGAPEMSSFLRGISSCLIPKEYKYDYSKDTSSLDTLNKLVTSTVTAVAYQIGKSTLYMP
jgi:hypothetical protein